MTCIEFIKQAVSVSTNSIENTLELLSESCTIPFIARYRKDKTGNLDEVAIENIAKQAEIYNQISKRKYSIIESIKEQNKLTENLLKSLEDCYDLRELEDLYLPYKKARKTRADIARENNLEILAKQMMAQNDQAPEQCAQKWLSTNVETVELALKGASDIVAEWINENTYIRRNLRNKFQRNASIKTIVTKEALQSENAKNYQTYFDWNEPLSRIASHRLLAILRAQKEGVLRLSLDVDKAEAISFIEQTIIRKQSPWQNVLKKAISDSYKRLLEPALTLEALNEAKLKADQNSIGVFAANLTQLLLGAPLGEKRILAIDPGFRSGCKVVCLDEKGDLLYNETIYPHAPTNDTTMAMKKIRSMVNSYRIEAIAIGNGTACRETEAFIKRIAFDKSIQVFIVNEAGASVYSASKIAREEFPNYDVTVRGAVSIGRRLADPLGELVKIDPKSIGVGQYQHDVDQLLLKNELDLVVEKCVNSVGININTASKSLLSYVSGIGDKLAQNIVDFRSENGAFSNREALRKVPRLGNKAYEQAAAFIRIKNPTHPLDNSAVHPESYSIVEAMAKDLNVTLEQLIGNKEAIEKIDLQDYITDKIGVYSLEDVLNELKKPGLDPRKKAKIFEFDSNVKKIEDLTIGQILPGIINNITNFGCFVDIGIKQSGLVHISQLKEGFVSDVNEVVKLHQHVRVKVTEVDIDKNRIQLSMSFRE